MRWSLFLLYRRSIVLLPLARLLGRLVVSRVPVAKVPIAISTVTLRHGRGLRSKRVF